MNAHLEFRTSSKATTKPATEGRLAGRVAEEQGQIPERIAAARKSFVTRRVDFRDAKALIRARAPRAGDLVLARVNSIGHHGRLETPAGRRSKLYCGDEIIVAYGARYAPDQFEADVPSDLEPCDLVAGGGIAARMVSRHAKVGRPTRITPIALLADGRARPLNLSRYAIQPPRSPTPRPPVIAVAGSSMNAGKTTAAAALIHGLSRAGLTVAGTKATGTGSGGDLWSMADAGADQVFDFTDMGHASTAGLSLSFLEEIVRGLILQVSELGSDVIILELADGIFQRETASLLQSHLFGDAIDGILFAAPDALSATYGVDWLRTRNLPVLGITGLMTASPLATREAGANNDIAVATLENLADPHFATKLCFGATAKPPAAKV
ncbi:DUF1611 domain-containing protein [Sphingopyxis sp. LC81]|uniref:DUF1611 domain-containing protein n=1 Tax=Sphingopyxis sp. LC81 TaxID=1502850 RepID=UPI00190FAFBD|nr:DUF1611 domain-containing protein [Sphingopyxis sp. LC81]